MIKGSYHLGIYLVPGTVCHFSVHCSFNTLPMGLVSAIAFNVFRDRLLNEVFSFSSEGSRKLYVLPIPRHASADRDCRSKPSPSTGWQQRLSGSSGSYCVAEIFGIGDGGYGLPLCDSSLPRLMRLTCVCKIHKPLSMS